MNVDVHSNIEQNIFHRRLVIKVLNKHCQNQLLLAILIMLQARAL